MQVDDKWDMKLGKLEKCGLLAAVVPLVLSVVVGLAVSWRAVNNQGLALVKQQMRIALLQAENTRQSISALRAEKAFDDPALREELKTNRSLKYAP